MLQVAVIDNGINDHYLMKKCVFRWRSLKIRKEQITHGTVCAMIIQKLYPKAVFLDLNVLNEEGTGEIDDLMEVLEWCEKQHVKVINMSLATRVYWDGRKMQDFIKRLVSDKAVLISSFHNSNTFSFPAVCKGVLGVRADRAGILREGETAFQPVEGADMENSMIAGCLCRVKDIFEECHDIDISNSFAVPVITSKVLIYLEQVPEADVWDVLKFFERSFPIIKSRINSINRYSKYRMIPIKVPVIGFFLSRNSIAEKVAEKFNDVGYRVEVFSDREKLSSAVPLSCYCKKREKLSLCLISDIEWIYHPSLIILEAERFRFRKEDIYDYVDMLVEQKEHKYILYNRIQKTYCMTIEELFQRILLFYK